MRILLPCLCLAALAISSARAQMTPDEDRFDFEKSVGPFSSLVLPPKAQVAAPVVVHEAAPGAVQGSMGMLRFDYTRKHMIFPILYTTVMLNDLNGIEFDVRSQEKALLILAVTDFDGAKFNYPVELARGSWKHVKIRPEDFKLSDDSPVKKSALEPARLGAGLAFLDALSLFPGNDASTSLWLDNLLVSREPLAAKRGEWRIKQDTTWTTPASVEGDLVLEPNVALTLRCRRFRLKGHLLLGKGARLRVEETVLCVAGEFPYQYKAEVESGARFELFKSIVALPMGVDLGLKEGAAFRAERSAFSSANLTLTTAPGSDVALDEVQQLGEVIVVPGARVQLREVKKLLLWFHTLPDKPGQLPLPDGAYVAQWRAPEALGYDLEVRNSSELMWGLVARDGCKLGVPSAKLRCASFVFAAPAARTVKGLSQGVTYADVPVAAGEARLDLKGSAVETWNLYAVEQAALNVEQCVLGELLAFGQARVNLADTSCDGSGGYFGARDRSTVVAKKCQLKCRVVAHNDAKLTLEDCEIDGDVVAADRAQVTLIRCKVSGQVRREPQARLDKR
ncbi:MAG: hypothetical protein M5U26_14345 [Planctomycetota bacterium]|nr:hypothetical protein [Planctomycetota bacterium]